MSSCDDGVCGTGGIIGPKPGDPNSISTFTATAGYGGINLNWVLPTINPFAVAHVRIFRATSSNAAQATLLQTVHGDFHFDKVEPNITYYYWLEVVSVNGTYDAWIGPASASAMSSIEKTIEELSGKIDNGVLAQALRDKIGEIDLLDNTITQEVTDRIAALNGLSTALGGLQGQVTNAITIVEQEVQQRIDGDGALVTQLNLWASGFEDAIAGVADQIIVETGPNSALAQRITTAEASLYDNVATGEIGLVTKVTGHNGKIQDIGALYTVKLNVNGLAGGFGVYNDGSEVEAGFDVDRFWVGKSGPVTSPWLVGTVYTTGTNVSSRGYNWQALTNHTATEGNKPPLTGTSNATWIQVRNKVKPFIIEGEVVYIDEAAINKLTFSKLRDEAGTLIVENGKVKANYIDTNGLIIRDANGNAIFGAGTPLSLSFITGLGSFATKNSLGFTDLTGSKPAIDATNGAPAGTAVNGIPVATLTSNAANGLTAFSGTVKYRTGGAPTNAPVAAGITITNNTNGTCNIRLDWAAYTQGTNQADFILLAWTKDSSAPGLADSTILFNVTAGASYYVFEGVNPADTYSFGIAAGRRTEAGLEITALHTPTTAPDWRGVTGGTPNFTANINGVGADIIQTAASNFNNRNDRNGAGITLPSVAGNGTAVDHVANTDGSVDISFEWSWSGNNADIDGWIVYVHNSSSSTSFYSFGSSTGAESLHYTTPEKRAFILFGVAADKYYTFGIEAYRIVDKDVAASGMIRTGVITGSLSGENPYQPASTVGFAGNITGTINDVSAATVITNATNGNTAFTGTNKFRTASAPSNNATFGTITQSQTVDGNIVVEVPYTYAQGTLPADKLYLYYREGGGTVTSADVAMATNPVSGSMEFILKPETTYSFGIQAVRTVDNGPVGTTITSSGNITTAAALFNGSIAGVEASVIVGAVNNFNLANDRNATAVLAPTLNNAGSCVDHTLQTDGSANISFEWNWAGTEGDIDGFQIFIFQSSTFSSAYNFGTDDNAETVYEVPAAKRAFIVYGTPANNYYTFGVRAYRKVDKDIAVSGIIASAIVKSTYIDENPYRPSASVAFVGNVTGTVNNIPVSQINIWEHIASTGGNKPENGADVTANNTAKDVVGQGALATRSDVTLFSNHVKFPNGDVVGVGDLVSRLAKLDSTTIDTFIANAAIGTALIGNAAIKNAQIENAAVNVLKIAGQSVTFMVGATTTNLGSVSVTIVVTADDIPQGASTVPVIVTGSADTTASIYMDMERGSNSGAGSLLAAQPPTGGVWSFTVVDIVTPGTYTYYCYNHGQTGSDTWTRKRSITALIGKR